MTLIASIAEWSLWLFGLLLLALQFTAHEAGYWLGRRRKTSANNQAENVGIVVGGMLGLLAFVLALTLSFANARFAERRAGTLAEANAIGTAWLRAEAIGGPRGDEIGRLLGQYTQVRENFARAGRDRATIDKLVQETSALQSVIWGHMAAMVREQPNPVVASLMTALNETFDASTAERFAFELRLPPQMFWLLMILTLLSTASLGYQLGVRGQPQRVLALLLFAMWGAVIVDILDLASARVGNFRTDASAYVWTRQSFESGVAIPPLPQR